MDGEDGFVVNFDAGFVVSNDVRNDHVERS